MGKVQVLHQNHPPSLEGDEVPGLRSALAAEAASTGKLDALKRRVQDARAEVDLRNKDRSTLMARAAAGEQIAPAALRHADEAIRDAEAAVTLAEAVIPPTEDAVRQAEKAVASIRSILLSTARARLEREYDEAVEACGRAQQAMRLAASRAPSQSGAHQIPDDEVHEVNGIINAHR